MNQAKATEKAQEQESPFCRIVANVSELSKDEWLEQRKNGIGGSDAGAILGLSKYKSSLGVYMEKVGLSDSSADNEATRFGSDLEPYIRDKFPVRFQEAEGIEIKVSEYPFMLQSKAHPFMLANLDGIVKLDVNMVLPNGATIGGVGGLEIKTAGDFMVKYWAEDELPDVYFAQVQHYMAVTGFPFFIVPVLLQRRIMWRFVLRNEEFIEKLIETENTFWEENVLQKVPPFTIGNEDEEDCLLQLYQSSTEEILDLSFMVDEVARFQEVISQIKQLDEEKKYLGNKIRAELGNAKYAMAEDHKITWSKFDQNRFNSKRLKEEQPDLYKQYIKTIPSGRLSVKGGK